MALYKFVFYSLVKSGHTCDTAIHLPAKNYENSSAKLGDSPPKLVKFLRTVIARVHSITNSATYHGTYHLSLHDDGMRALRSARHFGMQQLQPFARYY